MPPPKLKQFGELLPSDFQNCSVWVCVHGLDTAEDWYEETDEETVRPWQGSKPVDPEDGTFLIAAVFHLASGEKANGFYTPSNTRSDELSWAQPRIFTPRDEQMLFWLGMFLDPDQEKLDQFQQPMFPITFEPAEGTCLNQSKGRIAGFEKWK